MRIDRVAISCLAAAAFACPVTAFAQNTSNFAMVGYDLDLTDADTFAASALLKMDECEMIELTESDTACLIDRENGGQMWLGFRGTGSNLTFHTANPAFRGEGRMEASFIRRVSDKEWEPFEYRIAAEFSSLDIPVLIELADPRLAERVKAFKADAKLVLDVTAFTFSPEIYDSPEDFTDTQTKLDEGAVLAPEHFIPSGLFGDEATAHAMFGGTVLKAEKRTSSEGATHWWTLVKILEGATVNVVFDDISTDKEPKAGDYIAGEYWLSAQLIGEQ